MNHLEQLVAEWYEYRGYFVRRGARVGKRDGGGYYGEVDVVAFEPKKRHIIHVETSMDATGWDEREKRYAKKFEIGRRYIPGLIPGFEAADDIEQIVLLGYGGKGGREYLGGGRIVLIAESLAHILSILRSKSMHSEAVPEQYLLLRTLHFIAQHRDSLQSSLYGVAP
jgi:hypothetical protein